MWEKVAMTLTYNELADKYENECFINMNLQQDNDELLSELAEALSEVNILKRKLDSKKKH